MPNTTSPASRIAHTLHVLADALSSLNPPPALLAAAHADARKAALALPGNIDASTLALFLGTPSAATWVNSCMARMVFRPEFLREEAARWESLAAKEAA